MENIQMKKRHVICFLLIILLIGLLLLCNRIKEPAGILPPTGTASIQGFVKDSRGPVSGAVVRVQTTQIFTTTDDSGRFNLTGLILNEQVKLTVWAAGYYIGGGKLYATGSKDIELTLVAHNTDDNPNYEWVSAYSTEGKAANCQNCHADPNNPDSNLPFDEWRKDAHANAAQNIQFLTMYEGTDVNGNKSPLTRFANSRDYGTFPLPPDPNVPYYGPGYKLDFPGTTGNCAACHTPVTCIDDPYSTDPTLVTGVGKEGIGCDFCHKVWDVNLDPSTGLPYPNMPGVLSMEFRRPPDGHQFFAGPFDDVAPGEDTYTPIQNQSKYCAACHFGQFWGVQIYNSFGEWLDSPYSDPKTGQTCQDCHMPPGLTDHFALPAKGGQMRKSETIFSHRMPGAMDTELMQNAVTLTADAKFKNDKLVVDVEVYNDKTGHHVPTDSPLRHMILLVSATDDNGTELTLESGPLLPDWCGTGNKNNGHYAGLPGKAYAKILEELWTGVKPTGAYWNMTRLVSDNRIPAFGRDKASFTFISPSNRPVSVDVRLIFRRAFIQLMDWKSWDTPDVDMAWERLRVE
jgi:mono/diheme cytochrome c family protein